MLHEEHPDFDCKPGDKREAGGTTWTFGQNQFSSFWRAGPKDGTVVCSKDYHGADWDNPYKVGAIYCKDFESAVKRSQNGARKEYERALEIVRRYES